MLLTKTVYRITLWEEFKLVITIKPIKLLLCLEDVTIIQTNWIAFVVTRYSHAQFWVGIWPECWTDYIPKLTTRSTTPFYIDTISL